MDGKLGEKGGRVDNRGAEESRWQWRRESVYNRVEPGEMG